MSAKSRLKVAFIHPDLGIGGAERLVLDVAGALTEKNIEVTFLTNHFDESHAFEELKSRQYPVEVYGDWLPRHIFGRCQALCAYIRMVYLTLVCVLFLRNEQRLYFVDLIPIAIPFLKLAGEKVIYYCHHPDLLASAPGGSLKRFYRKPIDYIEMVSTNYADVILVNSEYTASVFRETFPQISKPVQVVYPTVANSFQQTVKTLLPKSMRDLVPEITSNTPKVFLSINRFHPAKKLDIAVEAMVKLQQNVSSDEWKDVFLILAGGYDPQSAVNATYFAELEKKVVENQLERKIILLKSPSDQKKAELLLSCHCLIYTPVKEHFGIVPLEAMTVAKPVIACNSGGPRETVQHGKSGFLCEPSGESVAVFMKKLLDVELAKEMGRQGKINLEKFSYTTFVSTLKRITEDLSRQN